MNVNDNVFVRKEMNRPLEASNITSICDKPRLYEAELKNGKKLEIHRKFIFNGPIFVLYYIIILYYYNIYYVFI